MAENPRGLLTDPELAGMQDDANFLIEAPDTTILVTRDDASPVFNETTGRYESNPTEIYSGPAIVFPVVFRRSRQEIVAEDDIRVRVYRANIPIGVADIWMKDLVRIVTSTDEDFVGKEMRVIDVLHEGYPGLRRFDMVDVDDDDTQFFTTPPSGVLPPPPGP